MEIVSNNGITLVRFPDREYLMNFKSKVFGEKIKYKIKPGIIQELLTFHSGKIYSLSGIARVVNQILADYSLRITARKEYSVYLYKYSGEILINFLTDGDNDLYTQILKEYQVIKKNN